MAEIQNLKAFREPPERSIDRWADDSLRLLLDAELHPLAPPRSVVLQRYNLLKSLLQTIRSILYLEDLKLLDPLLSIGDAG